MHLPLRNTDHYTALGGTCASPTYASRALRKTGDSENEPCLVTSVTLTPIRLVLNRHVQAIHALLVLIPPCACSGQPGSTYTQNKWKSSTLGVARPATHLRGKSARGGGTQPGDSQGTNRRPSAPLSFPVVAPVAKCGAGPRRVQVRRNNKQ